MAKTQSSMRAAMDRSVLRSALFTIRKRKAEAIRDRKREHKQIRESCQATRKRLSAEKKEAEAKLRAEFRKQRELERAACRARHAEAVRKAKTRIAKQRAERQRQLELHKLSQKWDNRSRGAGAAVAKTRRAESDDEVRRNLEPDMVAVFDQVRARIKGNRYRSRTEAFLEWAQENPEEVLRMQADSADDDVARLIREEQTVLKALDRLPRGPGGFEQLRSKQERWATKGKGQSPAEAAAQSLAEHGSRLSPEERRLISLDVADAIPGHAYDKLTGKRLEKLRQALLREAQAQRPAAAGDDVPF